MKSPEMLERASVTAVFLILLFVMVMVPYIPIFGFILNIFVIGWYAAFRFAVIKSSAAGEENLPDVNVSNDFWGDFIAPLFEGTNCGEGDAEQHRVLVSKVLDSITEPVALNSSAARVGFRIPPEQNVFPGKLPERHCRSVLVGYK